MQRANSSPASGPLSIYNSICVYLAVANLRSYRFTRAIYARPEFLVRDLAPGEGIDIAGESICEGEKNLTTLTLIC
jgi:hypothetical protein